jgi:hypothetical protein
MLGKNHLLLVGRNLLPELVLPWGFDHPLKLRSSNGKGGLWPAAKALGIDKDDEVNVILLVSYERYNNHCTNAQKLPDPFKAPGTPPVDVDKAEVEAFEGRVTQWCLRMRENILSTSHDATWWKRAKSWLAAHGDEKLLKDSQKSMSVEDFSAYLSTAEEGRLAATVTTASNAHVNIEAK